MIRKKKTDNDIEMTPLSEEDIDIDITEEMDDDAGKKPKKSGKSIRLPWKKKGAKKTSGDSSEKEENTDAASVDEEDNSDNYDPLNLSEEDVEYASEEGKDKKTSKKKIIIIAAGIVVCLALIITLIVKNINTGSEGKVYVENVGVLSGLTASVGANNRYTGVVEAQESWKITLDSDMSVSKCYVSAGDEVKKGDKLFVYNTDELKLNQEKKELEVETLQNEVTQLTKDIASYQSDLKSASASEKIELQTQILTSQTNIKKDQYTIKTDKQDIEKIKKNIKDATVTSKMDGVVKSINKSLGESSSDDESTADSSSSIDDGSDNSAYMTILSVGDYRVKGKISETNINSVAEGDRVIVSSRVDDSTWTGLINTIKTDQTTTDDSSSSDSAESYDDGTATAEGASSYYFYVEMDNADGLLMGQHVFIEQDNGQGDEKDGIWISSAYIVTEDENYYVWADNGHGKLEKRSIKVGEYDEVLDEYQVLSGIDTDDYIACDDVDLQAGMKTTKVNPSSADELSTEAEEDYLDGSDEEGLYDDMEEGDEYYDDSYGDEDISDDGSIIEDSGSSDDSVSSDDGSVSDDSGLSDDISSDGSVQ